MTRVSNRDYVRLLEFRTELRRFLHWSETQARAVGLTPAQHQLLLAIKGHPGGDPTVGEIAESLLIKHNSAVELLDRAQSSGLIERVVDDVDARRVRTVLTPEADEKLSQLTRITLEEIRRLGPALSSLVMPPQG